MKQQLPVTRRALEQRIDRAITKQNEFAQLHRTHGRASYELGEYFVLDHRTNTLIARNINLEQYGRKLNVLADGEYLSEGEVNSPEVGVNYLAPASAI
jgi:hypothetical protein